MLISLPHVIELASRKKILFREMTADDLDAILMIENSANVSPWSVGDFINSIGSSHQTLVAEAVSESSLKIEKDDVSNKFGIDSKILAFAVFSVGGGEAEVLNIAVAKESRKQGIAKSILNYFIESVAGKIDNLFLEVRKSNRAAIALYDGIGFNQVGLRSNYYPKSDASSEREDALIFAYTII